MYVLEGATLGGQLMARAAQQHLGISVASGGAFFFSYGPDLGHMWKSFGTLVQDYATSDPIANTIVAAACDTFETLDRWLNADGWVYLEVQGGQTPVLEQV
jgi:heme oxygenase